MPVEAEARVLTELAQDYRDQGYEVTPAVRVGGFMVDLVARRGDEAIYVEVKRFAQLNADLLNLIQQAVQQADPDARFRVVVANAPTSREVRISGLDRKLTAWIKAHGRQRFAAEVRRVLTADQDVSVEVRQPVVEDVEVLGAVFTPDGVSADVRANLAVMLRSSVLPRDRYVNIPFKAQVQLTTGLRVKRVAILSLDLRNLASSE